MPLRSVIVRLFCVSAFGQALLFLSLPLLLRFYPPGDFGLLALYLPFAVVLGSGAALRYEMAIPLAVDRSEARAVLSVGSIAILCTAVVATLAGWFLGDDAEGWFGTRGLAPLFALLGLEIALIGMHGLATQSAVRGKRYGALSGSKLAQPLALVAGQLAAAGLALGAIGLVLGRMLGWAAGLLALLFVARNRDEGELPEGEPAGRIETLKRHRSFPLYALPAGWVSAANLNIPPLLLGLFFGAEAAGFFLVVDRLLGFPIRLVGTSVQELFYGVMAEDYRTDPQVMSRRFGRLIRYLALGALALGLAPWIAGPALSRWLLGAEWSDALFYARALSPLLAVRLVVHPVAPTLYVFGKQKLLLAMQLAILAVGAVSLTAAAEIVATPPGAVGAYALATAVVYGSILWIAIRTVGRNCEARRTRC